MWEGSLAGGQGRLSVGGAGVKRFLAFIGIGSAFATVEEFLTVVVLKHDLASYIFTLLILFPVFLTIVYFSSKLLDRLSQTEPARELAHFFTYGGAGLLIEWFLIGLSPWSDPNANPIVMLLFQLGMFSFWATVGFAPRLFLNADALSQSTRKSILRFYIPYFVVVYLLILVLPASLRFIVLITLIIFGYGFLNVFYARYFMRSFTQHYSHQKI
jgi:hypothetical protein